jgi:hypothetical protein
VNGERLQTTQTGSIIVNNVVECGKASSFKMKNLKYVPGLWEKLCSISIAIRE